MKLGILFTVTALTMSSCALKLAEEYKTTVAAHNSGAEEMSLRLEVQRGVSLYDCEPGNIDKRIQVPAKKGDKGGYAEIRAKITCRMPPTRVAKIEFDTDYIIASAEIDKDLVFGTGPKGEQVNHLIGKSLEINSSSGRYDQLVDVIEINKDKLKRDFYFIPLSSETIGSAFVSSYGKTQDKAIIQIVLGESSLQIAADEKLTVSIPDLSLFDLPSKPSARKQQLTTRTMISHVIPFGSKRGLGIYCDDIGCNKDFPIPLAEQPKK